MAIKFSTTSEAREVLEAIKELASAKSIKAFISELDDADIVIEQKASILKSKKEAEAALVEAKSYSEGADKKIATANEVLAQAQKAIDDISKRENAVKVLEEAQKKKASEQSARDKELLQKENGLVAREERLATREESLDNEYEVIREKNAKLDIASKQLKAITDSVA